MVYYLQVEDLRNHELALSNLFVEKKEALKKSVEIEKKLKSWKETHEKQWKELEVTKKRIKDEETQVDELNKILRNIDLKIDKTKEIIKNARIITAIAIDDEGKYKLLNGLVSVNLYVVMKLLTIVGDDNVRNIIGISKIFYTWTRYRIFRLIRYSRRFPILPTSLPPQIVYEKNKSRKILFSPGCSATIVIDRELAPKKIFCLDLILNGLINVGLAMTMLFPEQFTHSMYNRSGVCLMSSNKNYNLNVGRFTRNISSWQSDVAVPVTVEFDASMSVYTPTPTLRYFANSIQIPHSIVNIPTAVYFAFGGWGSSFSSAEIVSLHIVPSARTNGRKECMKYDFATENYYGGGMSFFCQ